MKAVKKRENIYKGIVQILPVIFVIAVIPLITYGKMINLSLEEANFWRSGTVHFDFSSYYKAFYLVITTFIALLAFCISRFNGSVSLQKDNKYYIPMAIYSILSLFSAILSVNKHTAFFGFIEIHQGIFVLLSYMLLTFLLINYTYNEKNIKIFVYSFVALIIAEGLLGVGEYFGIDFFQSHVGRWLITPKNLQGISLKFTSGKYTIYGTMYNSNFVGSFGAMMIPLSVALYLFETYKKRSVFFGITSMLAYSVWLGCNSRAGYLGIISAFIIGIVVFRKVIVKKYKKLLFLFIGYFVIAIIFNNASGGRVLNQLLGLNPAVETEKIENIQIKQDIRFEKVSVEYNSFTIKTNKETLVGVAENYGLFFTDGSGNKLETYIDDEGKVIFTDEKYSGYTFFIPSENPAQVKVKVYGRNLDMYITEDQSIKVISHNDKLTVPVEAPHMTFFDGVETFASNRGYIWSRTIPMLEDTLLIGYGPDNFIFMFPHEDYVGRFNVGNDGINVIVDKPHNLYLQTAVNTGVLSLVALLFVWGTYLIDSLKIYLKGNINSFTDYIGGGVFLSILAYLVAGMFNDSIVAVAPLFWILLGMGIGINRMIKGNYIRSIY